MSGRDVSFDASAQRGRDAQGGQRGRDGGRGGDGERGQDAGRAERGQDARGCEVALKTRALDARLGERELRVEGSAGQREVREVLSPGQLGAVKVRALGGQGGQGGQGGRGGDGGRGRDGADATRHARGEDGGRGGDGGDGGLGSDGGAGGDGGRCEVLVHRDDLYLLMAVEGAEAPEGWVEGGLGGPPGAHGAGGDGGAGGAGGQGYSWIELQTHAEQVMNAQGQWETKQVERQVQRSNPGGSSGLPGASGRTPHEPLRAGLDGRAGRATLRVRDDGGDALYPARYDLALVDFSLAEDTPEDADGVLEFGEVVRVGHLRVRNIGPMPTPPRQRVRLSLWEGAWLKPLGDELFLARSLEPGEEATLEGYVRLQIAHADVQAPGDPLVVREEVRPRATQLGWEDAGRPASAAPFQREYARFTYARALTAQYPVENRGGVVGLRSLSPGEQTHVGFDVFNVSARELGALAARPRGVGVLVEFVGGEVSVEDVELYSDDGARVDLRAPHALGRGWWVPIERLAARGAFHLRARCGLRRGVAAYVGAQLRFTLWIEDREDARRWRVAQRRALSLRAEPSYQHRPASKLILVTHNNTTQDAFEAWRALLEGELGLPFDHWSLGRYGHLDFGKELDDGTTLRDHLEDKLLLVLNQGFQPRHNEATDLPSDYIKGEDFRRGATSNNTHLLLIGSDRFQLDQWLEPTSARRSGGDTFPSVERFLRKEAKTGGPLVQETFKEDITTYCDEVPVHEWTFFGAPSPRSALTKGARALMEALVRMHPNRRYVLVTRALDKAQRAGRRFLLFPRWEVGRVEVRRTLNTETSSALVVSVPDARVNERAFLFGADVRYAVLLSLPFEEKLDRLNALLLAEQGLEGSDRALTGSALVSALLTDLAEEQSAVMEGGGRLSEGELGEKLSNLGRLVKMPLHTGMKVGAQEWALLVELCAGLHLMASKAAPSWHLWGRARAMGRYASGALRGLMRAWFDAHAVDAQGEVAMDSREAWRRVEARVGQLAPKVAQRRALLARHLGRGVSEGTAARDLLERPDGLSVPFLRDIDAWVNFSERVWSAEDFEKAQERERGRVAVQDEFQAINRRVRSALLAQAPAEEAAVEAEQGREQARGAH